MGTSTPSALRTDAFEGDGEQETPVEAVAAVNDELADVQKPVEERKWDVKGELLQWQRGNLVKVQFDEAYVQKPLSYLAMMQFTGLLGRKIDEAMSGEEGLKLESIADIAEVASFAGVGAGLQREDFAGVDAFVRGFAKIAAYVPDIIAEAQCIWLRVPLKDRRQVVEIWSKPVDEGGLSMDEGEEMMTVFIIQNYEELERFFVERWRRLIRTVQKERKKLHPAED